MVHNFFVNVEEELLASVETGKVHTKLVFLQLIQINGEFDFLVETSLVGDLTLPLLVRYLVLVKILFLLKILNQTHEDSVSITGREELGLFTHVFFEFSQLTGLLLINVFLANVKFFEKIEDFFIVTITTGNVTSIFFFATVIAAFFLLSLNLLIHGNLSVLELLKNITL